MFQHSPLNWIIFGMQRRFRRADLGEQSVRPSSSLEDRLWGQAGECHAAQQVWRPESDAGRECVALRVPLAEQLCTATTVSEASRLLKPRFHTIRGDSVPLAKGKKGLLKQIAYHPVSRWVETTGIYSDKCIRCVRCHCLGEILISLQGKKRRLF